MQEFSDQNNSKKECACSCRPAVHAFAYSQTEMNSDKIRTWNVPGKVLKMVVGGMVRSNPLRHLTNRNVNRNQEL